MPTRASRARALLRQVGGLLIAAIPAKRTSCTICGGARDNLTGVYFTDRGIEELAERRGEEQVSLEWLAEQLRSFVDLHPDFETPIERLATWLARQDDDED